MTLRKLRTGRRIATIGLSGLAVVLLSCMGNSVEPDPYDYWSWAEFSIIRPTGDTLRYRFEARGNEVSIGGTYFTVNNRTLIIIPDNHTDSLNRTVFINVPGHSVGTFDDLQDSARLFLDLQETSEHPNSLFPALDSSGSSIQLDKYGQVGGRITGSFHYRVRYLGPGSPIYFASGQFSVLRRPDNVADTLFGYPVANRVM